ncbi:malonic semialdehyde reductase [uncultured Friedmanniella sp.]|uniref:malonic semialdehyde reductase n=1 Tax=uncultured Friedmanniella sp. TaxID=335381 RepID=UPI0035CC45F2
MTDTDLNSADLAAYEQAFSSSLVVPNETADLLFRTAQTGYAFSDAPVTDEQMRAVYDLVKWGPTAMNSQPLRIVLVRTPESRARLVEHMAGNNKGRTAAAPLVAVLAADVDFHDEMHRVFPALPNARDKFPDESARATMAHASASLQAGYFIIAVRAAGLVAGPMGGFDADAVSREFFPDGRHRAFLVVNLGHATAESYRPRQPRLDFDEVVATA